MAYFGGGGVKGSLHPSLKLYIDCFDSAPFPKMFPRGGGVFEQDPILVRDFRLVRTLELQWKDNQRRVSEAQQSGGGMSGPSGGGMEGLLDKYVNSIEEGEPF